MSLYKPVVTPKFVGVKTEPWEMDGKSGISGRMQVLLDGVVETYKFDVKKFGDAFAGLNELDLLDVTVDVRTYQGRTSLNLVTCSKAAPDRVPVKA